MGASKEGGTSGNESPEVDVETWGSGELSHLPTHLLNSVSSSSRRMHLLQIPLDFSLPISRIRTIEGTFSIHFAFLPFFLPEWCLLRCPALLQDFLLQKARFLFPRAHSLLQPELMGGAFGCLTHSHGRVRGPSSRELRQPKVILPFYPDFYSNFEFMTSSEDSWNFVWSETYILLIKKCCELVFWQGCAFDFASKKDTSLLILLCLP